MQKLYMSVFIEEKSISLWIWGLKLHKRVYLMDMLSKFVEFPIVPKGVEWKEHIFEYLSTNLLQVLQRRSILWYPKLKVVIKISHSRIYSSIYLRSTQPKKFHSFRKLMTMRFLIFYILYFTVQLFLLFVICIEAQFNIWWMMNGKNNLTYAEKSLKDAWSLKQNKKRMKALK